MKAIHIADQLLINPTNPVTVNLIGAGGTGSHMVMALAKIHASLIALGHPFRRVRHASPDLESQQKGSCGLCA